MTSRSVAVQGAYSKAAQLKYSLTHRFAGNSAGMYAHTSDHAGSVNYGDALARLCRSDGAFLPGWATPDYNKVVFGRTHLAGLNSGNFGSSNRQ
ncbi:MAG TPA: hypothetical protein VK335_04495 [Bryobacteraceae bacterium]|nr:hypothetical protein [Bryobacteraceae bacterium]HXR16941.1 hypothetical protein [Terriglobales bacterium]HZW96292.1 hypothetical protein [Candidatus Eremiobacteraceae bacterium]